VVKLFLQCFATVLYVRTLKVCKIFDRYDLCHHLFADDVQDRCRCRSRDADVMMRHLERRVADVAD